MDHIRFIQFNMIHLQLYDTPSIHNKNSKKIRGYLKVKSDF